MDRRCKTPIEEIQAAVDGAISNEQTVKLRQCLNHIDELEMHKAEIEREIFRLSDKYESVLNLIRTVPGFDKNPLTAIQVLSGRIWIATGQRVLQPAGQLDGQYPALQGAELIVELVSKGLHFIADTGDLDVVFR